MHIPHCAPKTNKVTSRKGTVSEETKIIRPTIIIQQLTDWKEYTVMHAKGITLLPANVHLLQKNYILVTHWHTSWRSRVRRGKGKREEKHVSDINLHNEKHVYFRVTTYSISCRRKKGVRHNKNGAYRHINLMKATPMRSTPPRRLVCVLHLLILKHSGHVDLHSYSPQG